jgi:NitT/TauT family transport system ATP-binding protein
MTTQAIPVHVPPICELREVSKTFARPDGQANPALQGISLDIRPNEIVAIIGPSGSGKSTLLRLLAGLMAPDSGEVRYHGEPLRGLNPGVALVFQSFALYPWMTVKRNIEMVLQARSLDEEVIKSRTQFAIRVVGLEGFEEAYPRELSGGMKQRVGLARALSVDPEILFLDAPFSHLDALTAENLRQEILDIWIDAERNPSSILMVSHDIKEVLTMADRIAVLSASPGHIRTILENPLPRPRDARSMPFLRLMDQLHDIIISSELPDEAAPRPMWPSGAPAGAPAIAPIPKANITKVLGLMEMLDLKAGRQDIYDLCAELNHEFGDFLEVVKSAELMGFVTTPGSDVEMTPLGRTLLAARANERKPLLRAQLLKIGLFHHFVNLLGALESRSVTKEIMVDEIILRLPNQRPAATFDTLINWGRYAELFGYNKDEDRIYLDQI